MDEQDRDRDALGGDTEGHGSRSQLRAAGDESDDVEGHGSRSQLR